MERLSDAAIAIINALHTERIDYNSEYLPLIDAANKLSAYEDTGLEPEEADAIKNATFSDDSECAEFNREVKSQTMTNGDKIRAITDEEIAEYIDKHFDCYTCPCRNVPCFNFKSCKDSALH